MTTSTIEEIIYDIDHYAGRAADYAVYPDAGTVASKSYRTLP
jgi:hypothetical protein